MSELLRFTIVIQAKNEAENLPAVVEEITALCACEHFEIIVDSGSGPGDAPPDSSQG